MIIEKIFTENLFREPNGLLILYRCKGICLAPSDLKKNQGLQMINQNHPLKPKSSKYVYVSQNGTVVGIF